MSQTQTQVPQTQILSSKFITIGRHKYTPKQEELLRRAGLTQEIERIAQVNNVNDVVTKARELGAAIVVQALPMHILAQLLTVAQRNNVPVYAFRIQALDTVPLDESCPSEADIEVPDPRSGNKRCSKTAALQRLKRIVVEAEDVATA